MNRIEHLLVCLGEECGEVAKECSKSLRFGLSDQLTLDPAGPRGTEGPTNRQKIEAELNDLMAVVLMCVDEGIISAVWWNSERQNMKEKRVEAYMAYAARVGALERGPVGCAACDRNDFSLGHAEWCPVFKQQSSTTVNNGQPSSTVPAASAA